MQNNNQNYDPQYVDPYNNQNYDPQYVDPYNNQYKKPQSFFYNQ